METGREVCRICGAPVATGVTNAPRGPLYCESCLPQSSGNETNGLAVSGGTFDQIDLAGTVISPTFDEGPIDALAATVDSATAPHPKPAAKPAAGMPTRLGRFLIRSILGQGAFGTVYRAFDPLLDREVALKVPRFDPSDAMMVERFHREAKSAARLHHPNIVTLYENGESDEGPYLVSEFVDGRTLLQIIRDKSFDRNKAVDWIRQISEALQYAHSEGIVHRDIKPGNIMINRAGRPQVMDFGLAKRDVDQESNVTVEGQILGTPNYMSPEQARGNIAAVGAHSDQYSVGVVLYEMLCGCTPFSGQPLVVMSKVGNWKELPPSPRSINPEIPRDLEACCQKAIEKDPKHRYRDLQALADDLNNWLKGLPLTARPIGPVEHMLRWCRQNRLVASLTGSLAVILLVLAIVGPWLAFRFRNLAARAETAADVADTARKLEETARLDAERLLIDNYTESGLSADRAGDPRTAVLWFANAVAASRNHPERERHNRVRMHSWIPQITVPILAVSHPPEWNKHLDFHPNGKALLSVPATGEAEWVELPGGMSHPINLPRPITAAIWGPDGNSVIAASGNVVATLEFPTGKELDRWEAPAAVNLLTIRGNLLFIAAGTAVHVRSRDGSSPSIGPIEVGGGGIHAMDASPDGRRVAVRTRDQKIAAYKVSDETIKGEPIIAPVAAESEGEVVPTFISNDRLVVFDSGRRSLGCWDLATKSIVWQQPVDRVLCSALSVDRRWLAVGDNSTVLILDLAAREPAVARIPLRNLLYGMAFDPQSRWLLTTGNDQSVRMFDVATARSMGSPIPHNSAAHRCVWSPDGRTFATVNWGGEVIRVWRPPVEPERDNALLAAADGPFVRFNAEGDRWISSGFDGHRDRRSVQMIEATSGRAVGAALFGPGLISDTDFVPRSTNVVLVGSQTADHLQSQFLEQSPEAKGLVRFVDTQSGKPAFSDVATPTQPVAVRVSPDGSTAVVLCHRGQVLLVNTADGQIRFQADAFGGHSAIHGYVIRDRIRFSPKGDLFAIWGCREFIEVRETAMGTLKHVLRHERDFVHDVQFSPDATKLASCSSDQTVRLWDVAKGSLQRTLPHPGWIFNAQFTSDGLRLVTACDDRHARIWDVETGKSLLATFEQPDQVFGVCLLPDEEFFLTSDRTGRVTAWESRFGKMIAPPREMGRMVYQLSLSGSGRDVVASGRIHPSRAIHLDDWILSPESEWTCEEMLRLGEILSSQTIRQGGAVTSLTTDEWMQRWEQFQAQPNRTIEGVY